MYLAGNLPPSKPCGSQRRLGISDSYRRTPSSDRNRQDHRSADGYGHEGNQYD
jgi:hypothetical protein